MGLSNKWTFLKTQNKKSLEHQALQICNFGVNQANIEQDIYSHSTLWKLTKKTAWTSIILSNFGDFYWLYLVQYWPGNHLKWGYPKALWALCNLWVLSWYSIIKGFIPASLGLNPTESINSISKGTKIC